MRVVVAIFGAGAVLAAVSLYPSGVWPHAATTNTVLFDREIVRILNTHCVMCHTDGGPSFSLASYEEAWLRRSTIHSQTLTRHMPPWAAVPGYGEFANANRLTLREQRFIVSWVEGLGPRNTGTIFLNVLDPEAAAREEIRARADFDTWVLGEPDLEIALPSPDPAANAVGDSTSRIQRTLIDPGFESSTSLAALEYHPANRVATRAAVFSVAATGQWLATWTPWHGYRRLPAGIAYQLAAGTKIVAEIHTNGAMPALVEPGQIGLHIADRPALDAPSDVELLATGEVPAGATALRLHAETVLAADTTVLALWPTIPAGIESMQLAATRPDGGVEILLFALDIPQDWPTPFIYSTPVTLPGGSRLTLTAYASNRGPTALQQELKLTMSSVTD